MMINQKTNSYNNSEDLLFRFFSKLNIDVIVEQSGQQAADKIIKKINEQILNNIDIKILTRKLLKMGDREFRWTDFWDGYVDRVFALNKEYDKMAFPSFIFSADFLDLFEQARDKLFKKIQNPEGLRTVLSQFSVQYNDQFFSLLQNKQIFRNIVRLIKEEIRPLILLHDRVILKQEFDDNALSQILELRPFYEKKWHIFTFNLLGNPSEELYISWKINPYFKELAEEQRRNKLREFLSNDNNLKKMFKENY